MNEHLSKVAIENKIKQNKEKIDYFKKVHNEELSDLMKKNASSDLIEKTKLNQEKELENIKNEQYAEINKLNIELKEKVVYLNNEKIRINKEQDEVLKSLKIKEIKIHQEHKEEISKLDEEVKKEILVKTADFKKELDRVKNKEEKAHIEYVHKNELANIKIRLYEKKREHETKLRYLNQEQHEAKLAIKDANDDIYLTKLSKKTPFYRALMSTVIWGLGQIFNRQLFKGLVFLVFQILLFSIEIFTGKYIPFLTGQHSKLDIRDTGIFVKGIWGVVTLGTRGDIFVGIKFIPGDRSNILLVNGLISLLIFLIFLGIYVLNITDAYRVCKKQIKNHKVLTTKEYIKDLWEQSFEYIVILPALILMVFFSIMPIIFGLLVAFTNYGGTKLLLFEWVGFSNFIRLLNFGTGAEGWGYTFLNIALWNIIFAILATITCFFGGLIQAIILNNKRVVGRKVWRTIIILPWAIPQLVLLLVISNAFNSQFGLINYYLREWGLMDIFRFIGLTNKAGLIGWLDDPTKPWLARSTVIFVNMFLGLPYYMALMTGVMTSIDREMYQAAEIDGATPSQQFWKITLPIVLYMTSPLLIMSFAFNLNNFGLIYFLTGGGPVNVDYASNAGSTDILISWIYKLTTDSSSPMYNMASVFSIIIFIVIGSFSAFNFTRTKAFKEEDMV